MKECDDVGVAVTVTMMSLQKKKKKEKSRIEYDIWWSKNWILNEKNYSVDDMFIRCIYV